MRTIGRVICKFMRKTQSGMNRQMMNDVRRVCSEIAALRREVARMSEELRLLRRDKWDTLTSEMQKSAREMLRLSRGL